MKTEQIVLPFKLSSVNAIKDARNNADLIGQSFLDGSVLITVTSLCSSNSNQVVVERELDKKCWSVSAGLIRLIVRGRKKKRVA